jgi:hypothetical protein
VLFRSEDSGDKVDAENLSASAHKSEKSGLSALKWGEIISCMLQAIKDQDQDLEMELRATIMSTYRRSDQQVDAALFKLHTKSTVGIKKSGKRHGLNLSKIKASDWLIPGFVIKNDLTLIYGNAGSGIRNFEAGLLYKTKKDQIYGVKAATTVDGITTFGFSTYFKLK